VRCHAILCFTFLTDPTKWYELKAQMIGQSSLRKHLSHFLSNFGIYAAGQAAASPSFDAETAASCAS
jgi:hypothetical protein